MPHVAYDYVIRRTRAAAALRAAGLDALLLSPGPDLAYLTGYRIFASERLTCLVLDADGRATLVLPTLEEPRAAAITPDVPRACWDESGKSSPNPFELVRRLVGAGGNVAVADQMWASFVLRLQEALPGRSFRAASTILRPLRARKDAAELDALRAAARAADAAYANVRSTSAFIGRSERAVAEDLAAALRAEGHDEVLFTIVASGPNGASPHHETGERAIVAGDAIVLDFGGTRNDYCSDISRTVHAGPLGAGTDPELGRIHDTVRRAQEAGFAAARAGATAASVDAASRRVIDDAGYGRFFVHRLGHGIGLEGHEHPYLVGGNLEPLEPGMAFSIEPGIYIPGRLGVRIEDIACIGADGRIEPLNQADHGLAIVT